MREQVFFDDDAVERRLGGVMQLASEGYILKDRQAALEHWLQEQDILLPEALETPAGGLTAEQRDLFVVRVLGPIVGGQKPSSNVDSEFQIN